MIRRLSLSGVQHAALATHLLADDGSEAVAILLCATGHGSSPDLIVREVAPVAREQCRLRRPDRVVWPGEALTEAQARAEDEGLTLVLAHSHPGGIARFSRVDDDSDREVVPALFAGWCGPVPAAIGSAVMAPGGILRARAYQRDGSCEPLSVRVAGDDVRHFEPDDERGEVPMAFGGAMRQALNRRCACVIGVSGTGSIVAEQVARLGFGRLVLIDFDRVEGRNLNRILNATTEDARVGRLKIDVVADAVRRFREDVVVEGVAGNLLSREAVIAASGADVLFSCVDSNEGRQVADLIAQAFLIPLVDVGVTIPTRRSAAGRACVAEVMGRVDYVQPGRSSLGSRGVYTAEALRAEYLARVAPDVHADEVAEGYIRGVHEEAPAVIALNMRAASAAVVEYLARAFPYRHDPNARFARSLFRLAEMEEEVMAENEFAPAPLGGVGLGAVEPPLFLPALALAA